jgi:hypothetical protein
VNNLVDAHTLAAQGGPDQFEINCKTLCSNISRIDFGETICIRHINAIDLR